MATLSANVKRVFEFNEDPLYNDIPVISSDVIYEGAAVGESASTGNARPLVAGDTFLGFATAKADNSSGAVGDTYVRVRQKGMVKLTVTGVSADDDLGTTIYASDDATFTTTVGSNTPIGKLARWVSGTTCIVRFEADAVQSL